MYENNAGPYLDPITVAIEASKDAVTLAPNSLEAHWARAYILQLTANGEQAIQEYLLAIQHQFEYFGNPSGTWCLL